MTYWLARSGQDKPEGPYTQAQLRQRYEAGEADMDDQVCLAGTQAWQDLGKLLALRAWREAQGASTMPATQPSVYAHKKRKSVGAGGCAVLIFGLVMLVIFWPVGLLVIATAFVIDHLSVRSICTQCGNVTVKTAKQCANCKAIFVRGSLAMNLLVGGAVGLLCLGLIGLGVWSSLDSRDDERRLPASGAQLKPQSATVSDPAKDSRLWAIREKVVQFYTAQGCQVEPSVVARSVTVKVSAIQGDSLRESELMHLAERGLAIWKAEESGLLNLLIKDTQGKYLVSADPVSGAKLMR